MLGESGHFDGSASDKHPSSDIVGRDNATDSLRALACGSSELGMILAFLR
jgi:hypothetical protein